ncbi:MAG: asparagine synthase C-terminal domain-containing protein [Methanoregula sp.]
MCSSFRFFTHYPDRIAWVDTFFFSCGALSKNNLIAQGTMERPELIGWIEIDGRRLSGADLEAACTQRPEEILRFGGEFFLRCGGCRARDHFGIIPGDCPKGTLICGDVVKGKIEPAVPDMPLEEAIITAVRLRSDEGVTALSGGVDSALVAKLAGRECVAVGLENSHDLKHAHYAAGALGLSCTFVTITAAEIEAALPAVVMAIPKKDPVNTGIALTQYFIARWAGDNGYRRVLTGQGADELFGGYARYSESEDLEEELARDFIGLEAQAGRDQAIAALHKTCLSMPYLDLRVVRAARAIPALEKVQGDRRKIPLREVAERHIPQDLAWYGKKAMQYGSGVWDVMRKLARKNGYKTSLQDYIDQIIRVEHGL